MHMRYAGLGIAALALLGPGAPEAAACGWLWACADRPHAGRAYRAAPRVYRYRSPSRWYLGTALPGTSTNAVGMTPPVYGGQGLLMGALPAGGPTLFGPQPAPAWGYYYAPSYGPPSETPSWWVEPRRRR
jgi:hypothetical protein